ncbi:MAG: hypothetical protein ACLQBK_09535 [Candidatus Sulfotelmatobacter sp.]
MRRLLAITAFALSLAVPLWAQHGGGHGGGGGGGHAGFGGGHAGGFGGGGHVGSGGGHVSSGHVSGGIHTGSGFSRGYARTPSTHAGFSRGPFLHDSFRRSRFGGSRFRGPRLRGYGYGNNCYGYGCLGYGYPWWGYYDPSWWDDDSSYDQGYEQDLANANDMNQQSLDEQRVLRQEEADGDQDIYARSAPTPSAGSSQEPQGSPIMPATVLVFRDGRQREIQNYAIVGPTLWSFAPQHTEKIPLADLNLTATVKANDDRGISFRLPSAGAAQ